MKTTLTPEFIQKLRAEAEARRVADNLRVQEEIREQRRIIIAKCDLIPGAYYRGTCRNAEIARWDGKQFHHWGFEFGGWHVYTIHCPEDELHYDVFRAEQLIPTPEREIPLN